MNVFLIVGSTNPVKIAAVKQAVHAPLEGLVEGVAVASGVRPQPFSIAETVEGAAERARRAFRAARPQPSHTTLLGIGLEGGVFEEKQQLWNIVAVSVFDGEQLFTVQGAAFMLPDPLVTLIRAGIEMGDAVDALTAQKNVKQKGGMVGVLTNHYLDRTKAYADLAELAIGLWYGNQ